MDEKRILRKFALNGITPKNKKKLHQMCNCDVQTLQTKPTTYKQCKQISPGFADKSSGYYVGPPQRFREIDAPAHHPSNFL